MCMRVQYWFMRLALSGSHPPLAESPPGKRLDTRLSHSLFYRTSSYSTALPLSNHSLYIPYLFNSSHFETLDLEKALFTPKGHFSWKSLLLLHSDTNESWTDVDGFLTPEYHKITFSFLHVTSFFSVLLNLAYNFHFLT